ncbi:MAG TPA: hypothetical protein VG168_12075 [Bryobacteraceae bacterium]|nr:hypothetical protein [Bryobacteraceae bacterium]
MNSAIALILFGWGALTAFAQTESLIAHTPSGPDVVLRDARIGATYTEINAFTARAQAVLPPGDNVVWTRLSLQLELLLEDGTSRELTMRCTACGGPIYSYFESSPWEATHVKAFAIRGVSGDYITQKDLPAYTGWVARDAACYAQAETQRQAIEALQASGCVERTNGELAVTAESNSRGVPNGAALVALASAPGEPPETHFGLVPKRLVHIKSMRVLAHVTAPMPNEQ